MDDPIRFTKLPPSTTIKEMITPDNSAAPSTEQKKVQTGIASAKDSFEVKQQNPLFSNLNTGVANYGSGLSGIQSPIGSQSIDANANKLQGLLQESKAEISSYLKSGVGSASPEGGIFQSMHEYLKMALTDVREDKKLQRASKEMSQLSAESRLQQNNQQIDQGMNEAREKADIAMQKATTEMTMGIVGGAMSMGAAAAQLRDVASKAKGELQGISDPQIESRYQRFTSLLNDLEKTGKASDRLQMQINEQEKEINKKEASQSDSETNTSASQDRRKAALDNIAKFLDILRGMNPQI